MASRERPSPDQVKALTRQLETAISASEQVRGHVERQLRRKPFYPDRRHPRHWDDESGSKKSEE